MITPVRTHIEMMDARVQKVEANASASSNDLQDVTTKVALNFQIDKSKANLVYQNLGQQGQYIDNIVKPAIQESIKSTVAKYNAEQLITKRPEVKEMVLKDIKARLGENNLMVTDFSIVDFGFSENFVNAIEEKQIAEQKALRAKNDLERIKTEAEQNKAKADGDAQAILARAKANAEAQKLLRESLSKDVLQLKAIEKWDGIMPVVMGEGSNGAILDLGAVTKARRGK
jgi:regulator of protease activity HflC (stomatin/prohibitin superfamily)